MTYPEFLEENLPELAREVIGWLQTGVLRGDKFFRLVEKLEQEEKVPRNGSMKLAEHLVYRAALQKVAKS